MATLIPIASSCHNLQLPPIEKDDRQNLNVRTGSASTLYTSFVFTHGGLTIGLELFDHTIPEVLQVFQSQIKNSKSNLLENYISDELFYLSLIEKVWIRVPINSKNDKNEPLKPCPRFLHEMCAVNNSVYIFGGLTANSENQIIPLNDLWRFDLEKKQWILLHDGKGWESNLFIPKPRFCHKMTPVHNLAFVSRKSHFGILIAGGKDSDSSLIYENAIFDLTDNEYVGTDHLCLSLNEDSSLSKYFQNVNSNNQLAVNYTNSVIVNVTDEVEYKKNLSKNLNDKKNGSTSDTIKEESIIVYSPIVSNAPVEYLNPLLSFKLGKTIKTGKILPTSRSTELNMKRIKKKNLKLVEAKESNHSNKKSTITPFNLKYPTAGIFGKNIVITGFLPNDYDISIFIFNKPSGKWSRLNIFCNHDYGSHRFWGGFAWQSHHKVVLLGNYVTSKTTSSIRYFSSMITVSLPITNILASSDLAGGYAIDDMKPPLFNIPANASFKIEDTNSSSLEVSTDSENDTSSSTEHDADGKSDVKPNSFNEYVHYAAPKNNVSTIRSVFPPAAVTLGRNAFEKCGDLNADFEIVSANGDRVPVSLKVLTERWGRYFIELLSRGYVQAVNSFEIQQLEDGKNEHHLSLDSIGSYSSVTKLNKYKICGSTTNDSSSINLNEKDKKNSATSNNSSKNTHAHAHQKFHVSMPVPQHKSRDKDAPQFRLPFQESGSDESPTCLKSESPPSYPKESNFVITPPTFNRVSSAIDPHQSETLSPPPTIAPSSPDENIVVAGTTSQYANLKLNEDSKKAEDNEIKQTALNLEDLVFTSLKDIPPQLPIPNEPTPDPPVGQSFRTGSRKGSADLAASPRSSIIQALSALRNIPRSPRESPISSPRNSISCSTSERTSGRSMSLSGSSPGRGKSASPMNIPLTRSESFEAPSSRNLKTASTNNVSPKQQQSSAKIDHENAQKGSTSSIDSAKKSAESFTDTLLNYEDMKNGNFRMEPSLIPRKLYIPFETVVVKAFCEFLYTGQVGNKWLFHPTTLDCLFLGKHYNCPLLYDLITEVLYGIIGRKETYIIHEGKRAKQKYQKMLLLTKKEADPDLKLPLDDYDGFIDTIDDGYLDVILLKKTSDAHKRVSFSKINKKKNELKPTKYPVDSPGTGISPRNIPEYPGFQVCTPKTPATQSSMDSINDEHIAMNNLRYGDMDDDITSDSTYKNFMNDSELSDTDIEDTELNYYDFELGHTNKMTPDIVDPRSKSAFDKSLTELNIHTMYENEDGCDLETITIEQLVSPNSPVPSDSVIDAIYCRGSIVGDIKLMLRSKNVKEMSKLLAEQIRILDKYMKDLEKQYQDENGCTIEETDSIPKDFDIEDKGSELSHSQSNVSLQSISSIRTDISDKSRFPKLSALTPFSKKSTPPSPIVSGSGSPLGVEGNDKESKKAKYLKFSKKRSTLNPLQKNLTNESSTSLSTVSRNSSFNDDKSATSTTLNKKKSHHGILHIRRNQSETSKTMKTVLTAPNEKLKNHLHSRSQQGHSSSPTSSESEPTLNSATKKKFSLFRKH